VRRLWAVPRSRGGSSGLTSGGNPVQCECDVRETTRHVGGRGLARHSAPAPAIPPTSSSIVVVWGPEAPKTARIGGGTTGSHAALAARAREHEPRGTYLGAPSWPGRRSSLEGRFCAAAARGLLGAVAGRRRRGDGRDRMLPTAGTDLPDPAWARCPVLMETTSWIDRGSFLDPCRPPPRRHRCASSSTPSASSRSPGPSSSGSSADCPKPPL
jgi:hypothetical protein